MIEEPGRRTRAEVPVPSQLRNPHPVIASLRNNKLGFDLTRAVRNRACRILQGLIAAAEREGYSAQPVRQYRSSRGYRWVDSSDHVVIDTGEASVGIRIQQMTDRTPHEPTQVERERQDRWGTKPPKYDHTPNNRLRIEIGSRHDGRQHTWSEGPRGALEQKLPAVLEEIAHRHDQVRDRRLEREATELERERQRQEALAEARRRHAEACRERAALEQVENWHSAQDLREYLLAMEEAASRLEDGKEQQEAEQWIAWAGEFLERLDPLHAHLRMPDVPEPSDEELRQYVLAKRQSPFIPE